MRKAVGLVFVFTVLLGSTACTRTIERSRPTTTLGDPNVSVGTTAPPSTAAPVVPDESASKVPMTGYRTELRPWTCPYSKADRGAFKVDCYQFFVPESRLDPTTRQIRLAVAVVHSTAPTPAPDPVIFLQGGPGGSALADLELWTDPASPWLAERDLILLDQRGTGYSIPHLQCDDVAYVNEFTEDLDAAILAQCVGKLRRQEVVLGAYNTDESAADVADLRTALQLRSWNLYGASYGTRLALVTMQQHPTGIRSVILDSVYPPGVSAWTEQSTILHGALSRLFADCRADPACGSAYPNLENRFYQTIDYLNVQRARFEYTDPTTGEKGFGALSGNGLVRVVLRALYNSPGVADLPRAIDAIARGDVGAGAPILIRSPKESRDAAAGKPPPAPTPGAKQPAPVDRPHLSEAVYFTVSCAEEAPLNTPEGIDGTGLGVPGALRKPLVNDSKETLKSCIDWRVPKRALDTTVSAIPTLVLAGPYDPVTPATWGQAAAASLTNVRFVMIPGSGHAAVLAGDCAVAMMHRFIIDPATQGGDDCGTAPPPWRLR